MGNSMDKVIPGLYVGRCPNDKRSLLQNGITHVLSVHDDAKPLFEEFTFKCVKISDTPGVRISEYFEECAQFVHESRASGGTVLIHCMAGISRAVTMTTMYLMIISELNYRDCLKIVKYCRPIASPNHGFVSQLNDFDKDRMKLTKVRQGLRDKYKDYNFEADETALKELLKAAQEKVV